MTNNLQSILKRIAESIDTSSITASMQPSIGKMKNQIINSTDLKTLSMTTAMSKQIVESINFTAIYRKVIDGNSLEYEEVFEAIDHNDTTDEDKEELIEYTFNAYPAVADRVNSELALTTLSNEQKTMFKWLAILLLFFGFSIGASAINTNDDLSSIYETVSTAGELSGAALFVKKAVSKSKPETDSSESSDNDV